MILSNCVPADIFNADDFGLFYQELPQKSLDLLKEKCSGGKHSKIRLTRMAATRMTQTPVYCRKSTESAIL